MADDDENYNDMEGDDYGDDAVDEMEEGNEEERGEDGERIEILPADKGTASTDKRSPILRRRSHSSWLLFGLAAMLLVQHLSAAAADFPTENWRSVKTKDDYKKFVEKNCLDQKTEGRGLTFLSWEQDQFALALKTSMLGSPTRKDRTPEEREKHVAEWMRLQAILPVVNETILTSQCKQTRGVYDDEARIMQLTENDILENQIVNSVFANMYKRGLNYADSYQPVYRERKKGLSVTLAPEDDQAFTQEVLRTLK